MLILPSVPPVPVPPVPSRWPCWIEDWFQDLKRAYCRHDLPEEVMEAKVRAFARCLAFLLADQALEEGEGGCQWPNPLFR